MNKQLAKRIKKSVAVCLLNLEIKDKDFTINWGKINIKDFPNTHTYNVINLWEDKFIGNTKISYSVKIPARDVLIFKLIKSIE